MNISTSGAYSPSSNPETPPSGEYNQTSSSIVRPMGKKWQRERENQSQRKQLTSTQ
uniref:Uncharacterized protein n=1 Tax=Cajanus cajan TaxID=3821 RepID=A0A151SEH3_CAJCA|nr:hypothetical protein KK1_024823 [Cajanus cajan]